MFAASVAFIILVSAPQKPKTLLIIEHRLNALNAATIKLDLEEISSWMAANTTPDYFLRTFKGKTLNAQEIVQNLEDEFLITKSIPRCKIQVGNFLQRGPRASCSVVTQMGAVFKDNRKFFSNTTVVDTWRLVKGAWKLASTVTTHEKSSIVGPAKQ